MAKSVVCHINVARGYRGGERQTELLIRELAKRGISQALICRRSEPLSRRLRDIDLEIRQVSGHFPGVAFVCGRAEILHVHEGRSVYAAWLRHCFAGTPYVITRRVNNPIREHRWAHKTYRAAAKVACVAPQVAEIVRAWDPAVDVAVVHSGSSGLEPNSETVRAIRAQWPDKFLIGHVGALDNAQKGQEYLLEVARICEHQHPELHFLFVGGGDDERVLRELAGDLGNVTFTGFVDNVGDYLGAFDLFVLPSNREGIGSILFDAMEQRLAIVASRVGGVPDIVRHNENGLLIDSASPEQLLEAIIRLYGDAPMRKRLGEAGMRIAADFTASAMCEKYIAIYSETLGRALSSAGSSSR
ncbi:MAG: glycosyltransferase family 4 protein [Gammaproteobacteria bacterium]|jgi:glycosyltransferase involved in cell wall biosynthesis